MNYNTDSAPGRSGCKYTARAKTCQAYSTVVRVAQWLTGIALICAVVVVCGWVECVVRVGL